MATKILFNFALRSITSRRGCYDIISERSINATPRNPACNTLRNPNLYEAGPVHATELCMAGLQ